MFLSTHADRQGVDISLTVFNFVCLVLFVCTVTDFSSEDKASGVKFFHGGSSAFMSGNLPFWETLLPQKPKIGRIGHPPGSKVYGAHPFSQ